MEPTIYLPVVLSELLLLSSLWLFATGIFSAVTGICFFSAFTAALLGATMGQKWHLYYGTEIKLMFLSAGKFVEFRTESEMLKSGVSTFFIQAESYLWCLLRAGFVHHF